MFFEVEVVTWVTLEEVSSLHQMEYLGFPSNYVYNLLRKSGTKWMVQEVLPWRASMLHPSLEDSKRGGGGGVLILFHKLILEKFTCNIYKRENFKSPFLCSRFQGNLEVFTKWKKKFMDHIYFGRQIMFNADSKLLESRSPFCEIQYYT